jgi:hypothetical protein
MSFRRTDRGAHGVALSEGNLGFDLGPHRFGIAGVDGMVMRIGCGSLLGRRGDE